VLSNCFGALGTDCFFKNLFLMLMSKMTKRMTTFILHIKAQGEDEGGIDLSMQV
jgi:hypothetical protein